MTCLSTGRRAIARLLRSAFASAAVLTALLAPVDRSSAQVAQTGFTRHGPIDPSNGYPLYFEDSNGVRLGLCTDPNLCFWVLPDGSLPASFPTNWPDEGFYFAAQGAMTGAATLSYMGALEAAFSQGSVAVGDQIVFTRIRIRATGLVNGATYTITHPYGTEIQVAGASGLPGTINVTHDVGIGAPGDFSLALKGNVGPFLTTLGFSGAGSPGAFVGDGASEVPVQGSPFGTNYLRIDGPGADTLFPANARGAGRAQIDTFVLQGQIATRLGAKIDKAYAHRTSTATVVDVWASAAVGQDLVAAAGGVQRAMTPAGDGTYFTRLELGAGVAVPDSVAVANSTDLPPTNWPLSPVPDAVLVKRAVFTVGGDLVVDAESTDQVGNPALTVTVPGVPTATLLSSGGGLASGGCGIPLGSLPPKTVTVRSAAGGVDEAPVFVEGIGVPGGTTTPVVANAGADATVDSGAVVSLNGSASSGPIATVEWLQNGGPVVALVDANTLVPAFFAPTVAAGAVADLTFTLTVRSATGEQSSDAVVVHVQGPPIVQDPPDVVVIRDARYNRRNVAWRASGTASLLRGQTITVYLGAIGNRTRRIGSAVVDVTGAWAFAQANNTAPFQPQAGDTTVWAESSLPGTPGSFVFRVQ